MKEIVTTVIGGIILIIIPILFKKTKSIFCYIKQRRADKISIKKQNIQMEENIDRKWQEMNTKIEKLRNKLDYYNKVWHCQLPKSKDRIAFIYEFLNLRNSTISFEQEDKLLCMEDEIKQLYIPFIKSGKNILSKKEKGIYDKIEFFNEDDYNKTII